jgi:hypothetical protein
MKKEDFTYKANKGGYMIYYKSRPIGGAGTATGGKNLRNGIAIRNQIADYGRDAQSTIDAILQGRAYPFMQDAINKIDHE